MQKRSLILMLFVLILMLNPGVGYCQSESNIFSLNTTTTEINMPIKVIPPSEATAKITQLLFYCYDAIGQIVVPLSITVFSVLAVVLIVGIFIGIKFLRIVGLIGFICCSLGLGSYKAIPFIVGVINGLGDYLNK